MALSCSKLTSCDKEALWEDITCTISRDHGTILSKDDVYKKWSNVLVKYKSIICDKLSAAKKTGGGPEDAELTEMELKVYQGKKCFEGITGNLDISMMPSNSHRIEMFSSPVAVRFQPCYVQTASSELMELDIHPPRKRKLSDENNLSY